MSTKTFQEITFPGDLGLDLENVHALLSGEITSYDMEKRYVHKDDHIVWALLSVALLRDDLGRPLHFVSQVLDISERKHIEEAHRFNSERLRLATTAAKIGVWEWNPYSRTVQWDDQMFELHGCDPATAQSGLERWLNILHPDDRERAMMEAMDAINGGEPFNTDFRILRGPEKEVRFIRALATLFPDATGQGPIMIGVNWDIMEERNREQQLATALKEARAGSQAKGDFLAVMSHEIRTPLTGILGFAELLARSDELPEGSCEHAQIVFNSSEALLRILDDVLDLSRLEAGRLDLEPQIFSPKQVTLEVAQLFALRARSKGITLDWSADPAVPGLLRGDARRLRQILLNLVGNAVKFTDRGGVQLSLCEAVAENGTGPVICFCVSDTGPGIPPHRREAIMQPFVQLVAGASRRHGGSGLGLSICKGLLDLMGGSLNIESEPGKGSSFSVRIPFAAHHEEPPSPKASQTVAFDSGFAAAHPLDILVAEDDSISLKLVLTLLRKLGYSPRSVSNGLEAVQAYLMAPPDCVLMDLQMPGLDGLSATREIRLLERKTNARRVYISALTANAFPSDREECAKAGMDSFLGKPIRLSDLARTLAEISASRRAK